MKDMRYIIADNVRLCWKTQNLTQAELAERADLLLDSIKRIESGKRTMSEQVDKIPEIERIQCILKGRSES